MIRHAVAVLAVAVLAGAGAAQARAAEAPPSPGEIVAAAPASAWIELPASDLMVMDLAPADDGQSRRVVIQLAPPPIATGWVGNVRRLAGAGWWNGLSIDRVQDNYVAQWGAPDDGRTPPAGLAQVAQDDYSGIAPGDVAWRAGAADAYAPRTGFYRGWPVAGDAAGRMWPVHCYGAVGVGRDMPPDAGQGTELYAVIGHAPRHLDANIALIGRVVAGMEHLSALPRGHGELGFYLPTETKTAIRRVALASDLPESERPRIEAMDSGAPAFAAYVAARENRRDPFFVRPAGGADICNLPVPVRTLR